MLTFFLSGGVPMIFILLTGLVALVAAVGFARHPHPGKLPPLRALSVALLASVGAGTCVDLAAVFSKVPASEEWAHSPDLPLILLVGLGESMSPGILGFSLLAVVWLTVAVGWRRFGLQAET